MNCLNSITYLHAFWGNSNVKNVLLAGCRKASLPKKVSVSSLSTRNSKQFLIANKSNSIEFLKF